MLTARAGIKQLVDKWTNEYGDKQDHSENQDEGTDELRLAREGILKPAFVIGKRHRAAGATTDAAARDRGERGVDADDRVV